MSEKELQKIAENAKIIVNGYAFSNIYILRRNVLLRLCMFMPVIKNDRIRFCKIFCKS